VKVVVEITDLASTARRAELRDTVARPVEAGETVVMNRETRSR